MHKVVAEGIDRAGLGRTAAAAGAGLNARLCAGGRSSHSPLAKVMAEGIDIGINVAVSATAAGMCRVTLFRACWGSYL